MRAIRPLAVLFVVLALGVVQAAGQSSDTGSLRGRVTRRDRRVAARGHHHRDESRRDGRLADGGHFTGRRVPSAVTASRRLRNQVELQGFKPVLVQGVRITVGLGLTIDKVLEVAALQETMTVVGESPIVDTRNTAAGATVTNEILENVPSSRDLWNTVQQVPGVVVPRENVGGFESTQLSSMSVHGSGASAVQHNLNGIDMTLMHQDNLGAGYFSTDSYEEIQVTTIRHLGRALARRAHHQPGRQERRATRSGDSSATTTRTTRPWRPTSTTTSARAGCGPKGRRSITCVDFSRAARRADLEGSHLVLRGVPAVQRLPLRPQLLLPRRHPLHQPGEAAQHRHARSTRRRARPTASSS